MHSVINLDKPKGISSHQAVTRVKRTMGVKRAGHAGTLDPMATGVLLVCTGEATKVTRFLSDLNKEYRVVIKLGEKTDTYDSEGKVTETSGGFSFCEEDIRKALDQFTGLIEQTPPMYSAVKMGGRPLYALARKGIVVERQKRTVMIDTIEITGIALPLLTLNISCSKGTYIRSLCNDIGEALGIGAHMVGLKRTRIGHFRIEDSLTLDDLEKIMEGEGGGVLDGRAGDVSIMSIDTALEHLREVTLTDKEFRMARNGMPLHCADLPSSPHEYVKLKDPSGSLFAIGKSANSTIKIERVFHLTNTGLLTSP
jgi:tRNA pseudouridine55 synthase